MVTIQEVIKDPEFQQFGEQDKIAILERVDEDFKALSPEAKSGVIGQLNRQSLKAKRGVGQLIRPQSTEEQAQREEISARGGINNFGRGLAGGIEEIGRGAIQTGAAVGNSIINPLSPGLDEGIPNKIVSDETRKSIDADTIKQQQELNLLASQSQAGQAGRLAGNITATAPVAFIPGLRANALKTPIQNAFRFAGQGAAAGSTFPVTNTDNFLSEKLKQVGIGGVAGAVLPPLLSGGLKTGNVAGQKLSQGVRNTATTLRNISRKLSKGDISDQEIVIQLNAQLQDQGINFGSLTNTVKRNLLGEVRKSLNTINPQNPAEIVRAQNMLEVTGRRPTLGELKRDFPQQQFEATAKNIGEVGRELRLDQNLKNIGIQNRVGDIAKRTGARPEVIASASSGDSFPAGQSFVSAATGRAKATQAQVSEAYTRAANARGAEANVPSGNFFNELDDIFQAADDVIPPPIRSRLKQFGFTFDDGARITEGTSVEATRPFNIAEADKLRKIINRRLSQGASGEVRGALSDIGQALDNAVAEVNPRASEAARLSAEARRLASTRFRELKGPNVDRSITPKFKNFPLKPFAEGGTILEAEVPKKILVNTAPDELEAVLNSMGRAGVEGQQAVADLQADLIIRALGKATKGISPNELGDPVFLVKNFRDALQKEVGARKLGILFRNQPELLRQINQVIQVGVDRTTLTGASNPSGTATTLISFADMIGKIPGLGHVGNAIKGFSVAAKKGAEEATKKARVDAALTLDETLITNAARDESTKRVNSVINKLIAGGDIPALGVSGLEARKRKSLSERLRE
jgi:hypothetical protein